MTNFACRSPIYCAIAIFPELVSAKFQKHLQGSLANPCVFTMYNPHCPSWLGDSPYPETATCPQDRFARRRQHLEQELAGEKESGEIRLGLTTGNSSSAVCLMGDTQKTQNMFMKFGVSDSETNPYVLDFGPESLTLNTTMQVLGRFLNMCQVQIILFDPDPRGMRYTPRNIFWIRHTLIYYDQWMRFGVPCLFRIPSFWEISLVIIW